MKCSYCGEKIPFLKRLKAGGKYCTEEHRAAHGKVLEQEGLARLLEKPALSKFVEFAELPEPQPSTEVAAEMAFQSSLRLERRQRPAPIFVETDSEETANHLPHLAPARATTVDAFAVESDPFPALDRLSWWLPLPRFWKPYTIAASGSSVAMAKAVAGYPSAVSCALSSRAAEGSPHFALLHRAQQLGRAPTQLIGPMLQPCTTPRSEMAPASAAFSIREPHGEPMACISSPLMPAASPRSGVSPRLRLSPVAATEASAWAEWQAAPAQPETAPHWSVGALRLPAPEVAVDCPLVPSAAVFAAGTVEAVDLPVAAALALAPTPSVRSFRIEFRLAVFEGKPELPALELPALELDAAVQLEKVHAPKTIDSPLWFTEPWVADPELSLAEAEALDEMEWTVDVGAIEIPEPLTAMDPPWVRSPLPPSRMLRVAAAELEQELPQAPPPLASPALSSTLPVAPVAASLASPESVPLEPVPGLAMIPVELQPAAPMLRAAEPPEAFGPRPALPPEAATVIQRELGEMLLADTATRPEPAGRPVARRTRRSFSLHGLTAAGWFPRLPLVAAWQRFVEIWSAAPMLARGLAVVAPLLVPTLMYAPSGSQGPSSVRLALERTVKSRAMVDLEDDFRSGLSYWEGQAQWFNTWTYDKSSFVVPGQLAFYRPTMELKDYRMEFLGQIEKKSMGFVFRATDNSNYHAVKIRVATNKDHTTTATVSRAAVIDGLEQSQNELPLPIQIQPDSMYKVQLYVSGDDFTVAINGQVVDTWTDFRHKSGGVGFFNEKGAVYRLRWVRVVYQDDFLGRICSQLSAKTADRRGSGEQPGVHQPGENHD